MCSMAYKGYDEFGFCNYISAMNADVWLHKCLLFDTFFFF